MDLDQNCICTESLFIMVCLQSHYLTLPAHLADEAARLQSGLAAAAM